VPEIQLQRGLRVPPGPASQALGEVLDAIAAQEGAWRGFALHAGLADLHLPDVGYIAIPIRLTVQKQPTPPSFHITFNAVSSPATFPTFKGVLKIEADGSSESILRLIGGYDVPVRIVGQFLDATLIAGVAARTLENFVDDLAAACTARVDQNEANFIRYRFYTPHA
jgi:hypothetical protein